MLKDQNFRWLAKLSIDPVPPGSAPQNGAPQAHPAAGTNSPNHSSVYTQSLAVHIEEARVSICPIICPDSRRQ